MHANIYTLSSGPGLECPCLEYFKTAGWTDEWIKTSREIIETEYKRSYAGLEAAPLAEEAVDSGDDDNDGENKVSNNISHMRSYILVYSQYSNMFYHPKALTPPKQTELFDELCTYLDTKVEAIDDVIAWWVQCCTIYTRLSHMVLNYLIVPGMQHSELQI